MNICHCIIVNPEICGNCTNKLEKQVVKQVELDNDFKIALNELTDEIGKHNIKLDNKFFGKGSNLDILA